VVVDTAGAYVTPIPSHQTAPQQITHDGYCRRHPADCLKSYKKTCAACSLPA